jgi:MoaA/NifB/PqqE/SkfB family radical SAM enzyme
MLSTWLSQRRRRRRIDELKGTLKADPSDVAARAELGELQLKKPSMPLTEMGRAPVNLCDVTIEIRNPCNYRCFYCVAAGHNNEKVKRLDLAAIEKVYSSIQSDMIITSFECGGGEPTVHPQFADLVRICASYGPVSFPTNNSQSPERWLPREHAHRLLIRSSVHPEAEGHLDRYASNARYLIDAGCTFISTFIAHPTRVHKIPEYRKFFADRQIPFSPASFIGDYEGKQYPNSHSDQEKSLIGLESDNRHWTHKIEPYAARVRNFRGIPCLAGFRSIYISSDGAVRRCLYDKRKLNKPLEKPEPCEVKACGCGLILNDINSIQMIDYFNAVADLDKKPRADASHMEDGAKKIGYRSVQDGLFIEHVAMYDELMRAYAKDEIPEQ